MVWGTLRDWMVGRVEGLSPTTQGEDVGLSFVHDPRATEPDQLGVRRFLVVHGGGTPVEVDSAGPQRQVKAVSILVGYRDLRDAAKLDQVLGEDADTITTALLDTTQWTASGLRFWLRNFTTQPIDHEDGAALEVSFEAEYLPTS